MTMMACSTLLIGVAPGWRALLASRITAATSTMSCEILRATSAPEKFSLRRACSTCGIRPGMRRTSVEPDWPDSTMADSVSSTRDSVGLMPWLAVSGVANSQR